MSSGHLLADLLTPAAAVRGPEGEPENQPAQGAARRRRSHPRGEERETAEEETGSGEPPAHQLDSLA